MTFGTKLAIIGFVLLLVMLGALEAWVKLKRKRPMSHYQPKPRNFDSVETSKIARSQDSTAHTGKRRPWSLPPN